MKKNKSKKGLETRTKMFLFARWISICYADSHLDGKLIDETDPEFDPKDAMSVLNRESGGWWKNQLEHFETIVYPNYVDNGTVENTKEFLDD